MLKKPSYLSPSALSLWKASPDEYFLKYLAPGDPPPNVQTQPMSIGSAFDAIVKSYLHDCLFGGRDPRFEKQTLFEAQVQPALRAWAWDNGHYVFEQYKQSGALADLMLLLGTSSSEPRFEFEIRGVVHGLREGVSENFGEVVLLGKPDVDFVTKDGVHVILDFKVNGYMSTASPCGYYLRLRGAGNTNHGMHNKCHPANHFDVEVNVACALEDIKKDWARQLAIYGWLSGEPVGEQFVTIIHQIVCTKNPGGLPKIRVAEHHNFIRRSFQQEVFDEACDLWDRVQSGHYFRELSREESDARCRNLLQDVAEPVDLAQRLAHADLQFATYVKTKTEAKAKPETSTPIDLASMFKARDS